jgi:E1A/CREB-binding protein
LNCWQDYPTIIKRPMDLQTMSTKLAHNAYQDPWAFCDDFRLIIDNAWTYNKKASKIYKMTTAMSEQFDKEIDAPMKRLGFCCGQRLNYSPVVLYCLAKQVCIIARDARYVCYDRDVAAPVNFCKTCFDAMPGATATLPAEENSRVIPKQAFRELINDRLEPEPFVHCSECGRKNHEICVLWHKGLGGRFVCRVCSKSTRPPENPCVASVQACKRGKKGSKLGC